MLDPRNIKDKMLGDARKLKNSYNKKDINHLGILLAAICIFLAILIPVIITNNEVKEAQAAAAEAARIAYEEARQAAIEAEKKAEEERLAKLNAALRAEQADYEAQKAAEAEAAKAEKEREELVNSINEKISQSVGLLIDGQTSEDFTTQYSIQENLISTQKDSLSGYKEYVGGLFDFLDQKIGTDIESIKTESHQSFEELKEKTSDVKKAVLDIEQREKDRTIAASLEEQKKYDRHFNVSNRVELTATYQSAALQYLRKTGKFSYGLKTGFMFDNTADLLVMGSLGTTFADTLKYNVGIEASAGFAYDFSEHRILPAFHAGPIFRYTIDGGFEISFHPGVLIKTDFSKNCKVKLTPLTLGISYSF